MHTDFIYDGNPHPVHLAHFTGKERDSESALDMLVAPNNGTPQQPQKPRCPPSHGGSQPQSDVGKLAAGYGALVHPLEVAGANGFAFLTSGIMYVGGGLAVSAGCLEPTPAEPGTCVAGVAAAGVAWTGATISGKAAVDMLKQVTIPAFQQWGCPE